VHARVVTVEGQPENADAVIDQVKSDILPRLQEQDGFKGFTLHVNRESGKVVGMSYFESEETLKASEDAVRTAREQVAHTSGASGAPRVEFFEVIVDTMA
jgi:heme-degrading monooxygenase HmoA